MSFAFTSPHQLLQGGLLVLLIGILTSCNPNQVYKKHKELSNHQWERGQALEFLPSIKDTTQKYNIYLDFRHVYGFQYQNMKVQINVTTPKGETRTQNFDFQVAKNKKEYVADCSGDICDLRTPIAKNVTFDKSGPYKYAIKHSMPVPKLPNVMEVGLVIKKVKSKK